MRRFAKTSWNLVFAVAILTARSPAATPELASTALEPSTLLVVGGTLVALAGLTRRWRRRRT